ncbi:MAG: 4-hydroxy-tetrahydrodipicolinate synthase [Chitinophagaceae bacterium]|nr:4-hydroxy-tetrahydrodipicolinate synthase [Chitinophagaceae bacterium]MCW5904257.1 4-hydroxy-tetrahydrodipicolinate synthase [Chitinophagaceae bacterium]
MSLRSQLSGTGVAIVTPFKKNFEVDFDALGKLIDFIINGHINFIVTLGTTGETPVLDKQEKFDIIQYTFEKVNNRVPIVVGIGGNNTQALVKDFEQYPMLDKAAAILSASPYYSKPSQEGIFQHYKTLAKASPKPILIYNVPGRTGRNVSAATTIRLANEVENIGGIKEASDDMNQCMQIVRDRPEHFLVVSGDDALAMPQLACGMDGVISVAANCFPAEFATMIQHGLKEDFASARKIHYQLLQAYDLLFVENNPAGVKGFLSELGIIHNILRLPVVPLSNDVQEKVKTFLKKFY